MREDITEDSPDLFTPAYLYQCSDLEIKSYRTNQLPIAGVDEAGRGPLAGPVVAAAVIWDYSKDPQTIADSKSISSIKRLKAYDFILQNAVDIALGVINAKLIDTINIHKASLLAMRNALAGLQRQPELTIIDGKFKIPNFELKQCPVIKGDRKITVVGAASIIAKVVRDSLMESYNKIYPGYEFHKHKGYSTKEHLACLRRKGPCAIHRLSYKPVKESICL